MGSYLLDNANKGIFSHGQEKACLHLWDLKESVAEKLSKAKGKTSAYDICLPEKGITHHVSKGQGM